MQSSRKTRQQRIFDAIVSKMSKTGDLSTGVTRPVVKPRSPALREFNLNSNPRAASLIPEQGPGIEIEVSFGTFEKGVFHPGIDTAELFEVLTGDGFTYRIENSLVEIFSDISPQGVINTRKITVFEPFRITFETKNREMRVDYPEWGVRISKSRETQLIPGDERIPYWNSIPNTARSRQRTIFIAPSGHSLSGFEVHFTRVSEVSSRGTFSRTELEIEAVEEVNIQHIQTAVDYMLRVLSGGGEVVQSSETQRVIVEHNTLINRQRTIDSIVNKRFKESSETDPRKKRGLRSRILREVVKEVEQGKIEVRDVPRDKLVGGYWNKPVNLKPVNLLEAHSWYPTVKLDGVRMFMFANSHGIYLINPPNTITRVGDGIPNLSPTLIDGEFMKFEKQNLSVYYAFDILYSNGFESFVKDNDLDGRLRVLETYTEMIVPRLSDIRYHVKEFFKRGDNYDRIRDCLESMNSLQAQFPGQNVVDGIILQPSALPYVNKATYKWKPESMLTIDFLVRFNSQLPSRLTSAAPQYRYALLVGGEKGLQAFKGTRRFPFDGFFVSPTQEFSNRDLNNSIIEFRFDKSIKSFVPLRLRSDKTEPNFYKTALSVWSDIQNPMPVETQAGRDLSVMRRYHNQLKDKMLQTHFGEGDVIVDIGSGRGGDLLKWQERGFSKVFAVEPNMANLKELNKRLVKLTKPINVQTINSGIEDTETIERVIGDEKVTGVVSFFSLTFMPSSEENFNRFIETMAIMPKGTKFVGMVMDGDTVRFELEKSKEEDMNNEIARLAATRKKPNMSQIRKLVKKEWEDAAAEFHSDGFDISQLTAFSGEFGDKISINIKDETSMVKDQEEYLVYFGMLTKRLSAIGYKLRIEGLLNTGKTFNALPQTGQEFCAMNRMFVFERTSTKGIKPPTPVAEAPKTPEKVVIEMEEPEAFEEEIDEEEEIEDDEEEELMEELDDVFGDDEEDIE